MRILLVCALPLIIGCATSPKEPAHFLETSYAARGDTTRHLRALDGLCAADEKAQAEYCIEAVRLRAATGPSRGLVEKAQTLCLANHPAACLLWIQLAGEQADPREARTILARACETDAPSYCPFAARIEQRLGASAEAMKRAKKGCAREVASSCHDVGLLAAQQDDVGIAAVQFQKACHDGVDEACFDRTLALRSQGKDVQEALELSCQDSKNPLACELGTIDAEKRADSRWLVRTELLCKNGSPHDCYRVTLDQYYRPGGRSLAKFRFTSLCATGNDVESCFMKLRNENPLGMREAQMESVREFCERGAPLACYASNLGNARTEAASPTVTVRKVAREQLVKDCEQDHRPGSCEEKAKLAFQEKDDASARYFMEKACEFGGDDACAWVVTRSLEAQADGREESHAIALNEAAARLGKACLAGSVIGCEKRLELLKQSAEKP